MFTGLVQGMGRVARMVRKGAEARLDIEAPVLTAVQVGESISVSGVCLTVTQAEAHRFRFDVSEETLSRSTLGRLAVGDAVNLERALQLSDRLGGHLVTGHIDAKGTLLVKRPSLSSVKMKVEIPEAFSKYVVAKGSIAVDGISLTVNACGPGFFEVNIVPHTWNATTLQFRSEGDPLNIETDLIGKYVERLLHAFQAERQDQKPAGVSLETLARHGFV